MEFFLSNFPKIKTGNNQRGRANRAKLDQTCLAALIIQCPARVRIRQEHTRASVRGEIAGSRSFSLSTRDLFSV